MVLEEGHRYEICLQIYTDVRTCLRIIGTGFTDDKNASRAIRTGFTDRIVVSHGTQEYMKRSFLMDESLYKGHLAWLLLIHILHFNEDTSMFGTLQHILYMYEDTFCWHIYSKNFQTFVFMSSLCGVGVRVRVNNFFSKTTRPRDMLFFFKRYLIYRG